MRPPLRFLFSLALVLALAGLAAAQDGNARAPELLEVLHESTVPANRGERVRLAIHHYPAPDATDAVIVVSPDPLPVQAAFGLEGPGLGHLAALAGHGLDVYGADVTGYGLSPRPRMRDPCNTPHDVQNELLIPHPLYIPCSGGYERVLTSLETDWDEIDALVDQVIEQTGDARVALVGWGVGAARAAGYASRNPDKVERLALIAPAYDPDAPDDVPSPYPEGFPLVVNDVTALLDEWRAMSTCDGFGAFDEVAAALPAATNRLDPLAAEWGLIAGDLFRSPGRVGLNGWNRDSAARVSTPTLIVHGESDARSPRADVLFEDLGADETLRLDVECGTHWLLWEGTRGEVADAVAEFLTSGELAGRSEGSLRLRRDGSIE